jgi:hypothetical protein
MRAISYQVSAISTGLPSLQASPGGRGSYPRRLALWERPAERSEDG